MHDLHDLRVGLLSLFVGTCTQLCCQMLYFRTCLEAVPALSDCASRNL